MKIGCIGSGNMGYALMKSLAFSGTVKNLQFVFCDADHTKALYAAELPGGSAGSSNSEAVEKCDYIFLAVKPQVLKSVLEEITPVLKERFYNSPVPVLVSMAPGWTIEKIQDVIGISIPVVRIMPNTPCLISKGMIAMTCSPEILKEQADKLFDILSCSGIVDRTDESYLDAVTALSGSGPAYASIFIEALADGGVLAGLPREKAQRYAAQTVLGAAAMVLETGKHPGELKDMVASPGGTTIAGIKALENSSFRASVINAVEASWKRAKVL